MWLITDFGFFSVVQKPDDIGSGMLTVRGRIKKDLEELRDKYLTDMGGIVEGTGIDFKYRARVKRTSLTTALSKIIIDLDYSNFNNSVAEKQGPERAKTYGRIRDLLYELQDKEKQPTNNAAKEYTQQKKQNRAMQIVSYGGVLFNSQGQVLLRKPVNEPDGYVWTFPKGLHRMGIAPEETALKEVREKTGYSAEIIGKISGVFQGGAGINKYFLMIVSGNPHEYDKKETAQIKWVSIDEAPAYIRRTRNEIGKQQDLKILEAAWNKYQQLNEINPPHPSTTAKSL
jgi:ADP-ribose pyrophosphatase YjhB (NUDIX family)